MDMLYVALMIACYVTKGGYARNMSDKKVPKETADEQAHGKETINNEKRKRHTLAIFAGLKREILKASEGKRVEIEGEYKLMSEPMMLDALVRLEKG
jgi:hypothetical protein